MEKFKAWAYNFMSGRYGFDDLARSMGVWIIVLLIASIVLSLLTNLFAGLLRVTSVAYLCYILRQLCYLAILVLAIVMIFRFFSRKHDKREAENERYLARRAANASGNARSQELSRTMKDRRDYKYLDCPFCGQKMRVPRGKGKIAVKCPACGEKTIVKS